jgi:hypothetical protein
VGKKNDAQRVQSHYRAGTREVRNPQWTELKRELDAAQDTLAHYKDQMLVVGKKPKPEVAQKLQELQTSVEDVRKKLDAVPETKLEDIIEPYNYTRRTIEMNGIVEFSFRLLSAGGTAREAIPVKIEVPKTSIVLENVKAEDTDGVQEDGAPPDELEVLNEAETQAQSALVKRISEKLQELSSRVLEDARKRASANDTDGAAERYILFLNCSTASDSPERAEALRFLEHEYNISQAHGE